MQRGYTAQLVTSARCRVWPITQHDVSAIHDLAVQTHKTHNALSLIIILITFIIFKDSRCFRLEAIGLTNDLNVIMDTLHQFCPTDDPENTCPKGA